MIFNNKTYDKELLEQYIIKYKYVTTDTIDIYDVQEYNTAYGIPELYIRFKYNNARYSGVVMHMETYKEELLKIRKNKLESL